MSTLYSQLGRAFVEYRSKSISQSLQEMLSNSINIGEAIRATASTSQQNLRDFLQKESERDSDFPRVLNYADRDFLGGSFARHTKTPPLNDIDVFVPLDGANLFYYENGAVLPYEILSDGLRFNPLLAPRWANGPWVSSSKVIDGFSSVLRRRFAQTDVKPAGQAITVQMTYGQTEQNNGLGFDVVPCFSLRSQGSDGIACT